MYSRSSSARVRRWATAASRKSPARGSRTWGGRSSGSMTPPLAQRDAALEDVAELAHVAGPVIAEQQALGRPA